MMWHDHENYFRALGIVALIVSSVFVPGLSSIIFSFAVFCRGSEVLTVLAEERRNQEGWSLTFARARFGTIASVIGLTITCPIFVWAAVK